MSTDRAAYTTGLRQLADLLDANPVIPLPYPGSTTWAPPMAIHTFDRDTLIATIRALPPGTWDKHYGDGPLGFDLTGSLAGLRVRVSGNREDVCERVVVGTETVTVPAEPAREATPERVETVEVVEWKCSPILADRDDQAAAS